MFEPTTVVLGCRHFVCGVRWVFSHFTTWCRDSHFNGRRENCVACCIIDHDVWLRHGSLQNMDHVIFFFALDVGGELDRTDPSVSTTSFVTVARIRCPDCNGVWKTTHKYRSFSASLTAIEGRCQSVHISGDLTFA